MTIMPTKNNNSPSHRRTSIGKSNNSRPNNKQKRRQWKAYNKQGK